MWIRNFQFKKLFFLKKHCRSFYFMNTWKQTFRWKTQKVFQENIFFSCVKPGHKNVRRKTQNNIFLQNFSRVKPSGKKKLSGEFYFQSASKMSWSWSIKWNKQKHSSTSELYFHSIWISAATRVFQDSFCLCLIHTSSAPLLTYLFPKKNFKMKLSVEKGAEWNAVLRVCEIDPVWVWRRRPAGSINPDCSLQSGLHLFKVCFSQQDSTSLFCSI